ncbi:MAG: hypothetical protein KGV59_04525 [Tenacibaculum sp.]|nr:hypothetical protein [Tenacibaculum sp.]
MKKLILFLAFTVMATASFVSCSKDDDDTNDLIVGTWKINQTVEDYETPEDYECDKKSSVTFNSNGKFLTESWEVNDDKKCVKEEVHGSWENTGKDIYKIILFDKEGKKESEKKAKITFSNNNKTMTINSINSDEDYDGEVYTRQ